MDFIIQLHHGNLDFGFLKSPFFLSVPQNSRGSMERLWRWVIVYVGKKTPELALRSVHVQLAAWLPQLMAAVSGYPSDVLLPICFEH